MKKKDYHIPFQVIGPGILSVKSSDLIKSPKIREQMKQAKEIFNMHRGHRCHAGRDGECDWHYCPQLRDGEPEKTGRHCPLDTEREEEC